MADDAVLLGSSRTKIFHRWDEAAERRERGTKYGHRARCGVRCQIIQARLEAERRGLTACPLCWPR